MKASLSRKYRSSILSVKGGGKVFTFSVDSVPPAMSKWLTQVGAKRWIVITAYNPGSRLLKAAENHKRYEQLRRELKSAGLTFVPADSSGQESSWPVERGFLVLNLNRSQTVRWARRYRQNAVFACGPSGKIRLIWA